MAHNIIEPFQDEMASRYFVDAADGGPAKDPQFAWFSGGQVMLW